ncbi:MAG: maleylpyruvate isomerase family mycothiol-dependent enzyme [Acidimicrobiia bacterium]|nr:maleylpyruvate isomerase family mycothiol-dependent enzyme [Acidimicrobiia bacterium]NNL12533.1 maleylpyruvate isomerase family mycothiol-dependent enzyme [Acidimicrobiia bacterium]NNL69602.1 maleylpyruvate isomerase family mycothiol-dependent enzyme [Acidimicrobiia bacterium]RZV42750.1 MAG: maleylpyruvate isomerase family mycothiol-dependent enzyme [Acidimicrobiia bacterium]
MADVSEVYLETYRRFSALAAELTSDELAIPVVACPGWSAKDTIGHVAGIAVDLVAGEGTVSASDSTARQVEERRDRPIGAVLDEWAAAIEPLATLLRAAGSGLTAVAIDLWSHEQDVRNAINRPGGRDAPGLWLTLKAAVSADQKVRAAGLAPMRLVTGEKIWFIGDGAREGADVILELDPYEAARMLMGRRTYEEMAAYPWVGDSSPYLPLIHQFTVPEHPLGE